MRARTSVAAASILAGVLAFAACTPTGPSTRPSPSSAPSASAGSAEPVGSVPASSPASPAPASSPGAVAVVDSGLLDLLPDDVDGQALRPDPETAAEIVATGDLASDIEAIAVGLYVGAGSSTADDLAIVNVVRLRPGVFGEAWYRSWRSTYDQGACEVAGGVAPGSAESVIGGHETSIGSCLGGVHTYHVHLVDPDRVISITAAGEQRFGERVVAGLTE